MDPEPKIEMGFVQRRLPWLIAAVALVVYLITLNHSSTFAGVSSLAKAAGWDWRANVVAPLHILLTLPVRWLPVSLQLISLNLIAALCASLALALLARSVALLPHDRTREQRAIERSDYSMLSIGAAWAPPVLAALVCGFQLTFWENAVVATGEAFDLLLFAWLVHTLLQYRLDEKESRLTWFAVVYGLAVTNNYAMVAFFPAFAIALFWIKGMSLFRWQFLLRMTGCGLAGLMLYLLLPALEGGSNPSGYTFWELLRTYWGYQKNMLLGIPRYVVLLCSFTSLLPVLFMGIRWPAQFGEVSPVGNALTNLMTHVIHGVFLLACLYVTFDPPFSPRNLIGGQLAFLPLYFLGALAIAYCTGYFLLVFGGSAKAGPQTWQRPSAFRRAVNYAVLTLVWAALVAAPAALLIKNLPVIMASSGQAMSRLSQAAAKSLPEQGAVVLSDDLFRLYALQYELLKTNPRHNHILVDTASLASAGYHAYLQKQFPQRWPKFAQPPDPKALLNSIDLIEILYQLHRSGPVYYLHPSFGYYFERFHAKPHQMVYEMVLLPTNSITATPLTAAEIKEQDAYWRAFKPPELDPLIRKAMPYAKPKPGKDRPKPRTLESYLADGYSRALTYFGAELQKAGAMPLAGEYFDWALQLNPANPAAYVNLTFNRQWREGKRAEYKPDEAALGRLSLYGGRWDAALETCGPVDQPSACYVIAQAFQEGGNFRQAGQFLERTIDFFPDNRSAQLVSVFLHVMAGLPDLALQRAAAFRARFGAAGLSEDDELELLRAEAWAYVSKNELPAAERILTAAQAKYPRQSTPWDTQADIYMRLGRVTNAIETLEKQLRLQPDNPQALVKYGGILIGTTNSNNALIQLDHALRLSPNNEAALWNRALANFSLERLDAAQRDFQSILDVAKSSYRILALYELAEVHFRKKNRKESLRYYKEFLKAAAPGAPQIPVTRERIKLLESGGSF
jgi:tetratricopeptide (TPR) repeat protein